MEERWQSIKQFFKVALDDIESSHLAAFLDQSCFEHPSLLKKRAPR